MDDGLRPPVQTRPVPAAPEPAPRSSPVTRFLGGSPGAVLLRLVFLSVLVGAAMAFLGITPMGLFESLRRLGEQLMRSGFAMAGDVARWFIYGAMVVVPIWLILRLLDRNRR